MTSGQPRSPRDRLGAVTFVIAVLGALLAVIPVVAPLGMLLCLVAIIPAIVAFRRVRKGTATNPRRALAALVIAPVFFAVALGVTATTSPPLPDRASTSALRQSPGGNASPAPSPALPAAAPARAPSAPVSAPAAASTASGAVAVPAPAPPTAASAPVRVPATAAPAPVRSPAPVLAAPPAQRGPVTSASCDEGTHYLNSDGACVPRPLVAPAPPAGATARCVDGTYSFSQHAQGTCSGHGGVAQRL
jgi:hypothetical protein